MKQVKQVLIAMSQLLNTLFLGGYADESTSSRCWRMRNKSAAWGALFRFVDWLFGSGHCEASYYSEIVRLQFPPELRDNPPTLMKFFPE